MCQSIFIFLQLFPDVIATYLHIYSITNALMPFPPIWTDMRILSGYMKYLCTACLQFIHVQPDGGDGVGDGDDSDHYHVDD